MHLFNSKSYIHNEQMNLIAKKNINVHVKLRLTDLI